MTARRPKAVAADASQAFYGGRTATKAPWGVSTATAPESKPLAAQTLVIEDFPEPSLARTLSPNGRAHWAVKLRANTLVRDYLWLAITRRSEPLRPVLPPVRITYRWIVPDRKRRDIDNASTGVVKVIQDVLVEREYLPAGDHSAVLTSRTEIVYQRGRRALEIVLEPAGEVE